MMDQHRWFIAEGIFKATVTTSDGDISRIRERLIFLVNARDSHEAVDRAEDIARSKEHFYKNQDGQIVKWSFVILVDVTEVVDQELQDGSELKSEMIELIPSISDASQE